MIAKQQQQHPDLHHPSKLPLDRLFLRQITHDARPVIMILLGSSFWFENQESIMTTMVMMMIVSNQQRQQRQCTKSPTGSISVSKWREKCTKKTIAFTNWNGRTNDCVSNYNHRDSNQNEILVPLLPLAVREPSLWPSWQRPWICHKNITGLSRVSWTSIIPRTIKGQLIMILLETETIDK